MVCSDSFPESEACRPSWLERDNARASSWWHAPQRVALIPIEYLEKIATIVTLGPHGRIHPVRMERRQWDGRRQASREDSFGYDPLTM